MLRARRLVTEWGTIDRYWIPSSSHHLEHSRMPTMRTTIDSSGRLVIPKEIRRQAGILSGMTLDIRWQNGRIEIEPALAPIRLVRKGRFLVAVPETEGELLTAETVEEMREAVVERPPL